MLQKIYTDFTVCLQSLCEN